MVERAPVVRRKLESMRRRVSAYRSAKHSADKQGASSDTWLTRRGVERDVG